MGRIGVGAYDWFQEKFGKVVLGIDFSAETVALQRKLGRSVNDGVDTAFNIYGEAGAGLAAHVCESLETYKK